MAEHPAYRPFALLAFGSTVVVGTPVGVWLLAAYHGAAPAAGVPWLALHTHVQVLGFFGALIVGVAPHLWARFTGRPLPARGAPAGAWALLAALALRVAGTAASLAWIIAVAAALEAVVFIRFAVHTWRALDPPPLARLRRHLTAASGWLAVAAAGELALRVAALAQGPVWPATGHLRALDVLALHGGVLGWVLGVLLRAGPMFVAGWAPGARLTAALPWLLGAGAVLSAIVESPRALAPRLGDLVVLGTAAAVIVGAGAFRRVARGLPMAGHTGDEARLFKLAAASLVAATLGALVNAVAALAGTTVPLLADAVRHLLTIGTIGTIATAMSFRLMPVLEGRALPWPGLRRVALVALVAAVIGRTVEILLPAGAPVAAAVIASGALAWIAFAAVAGTLTALALRGGGAPLGRARPSPGPDGVV
jgi:hypothetical protein